MSFAAVDYTRFAGGADANPDDADDASDDTFEGLVAVDAEGYVVFLYYVYALESWDRVPGDAHEIVLQADQDTKSTVTWTATEPNGFAKHWYGNAQLQAITPLGELRDQYVSSCAGHPLNGNGLSHECRADVYSGDAAEGPSSYQVLSTRYKPRKLPNTTLETKESPDTPVARSRADVWAGTEIVAWDRATGAVEPLYDMFDFADPRDIMFPFAWNTVLLNCGGDVDKADALSAVEFHHISSVSVSEATGDYIVASRELSTVWSLFRDGSGARWTLSTVGPIVSDFTFADDRDKFWQPHDVLQLAGGDLLVVDDGMSRPGCTMDVTVDCFSRAVRYALEGGAAVTSANAVDHAPGRVAVVWQYEYPLPLWGNASNWDEVMRADVYNQVGGSLVPLHGGKTFLWGLTSMSAADGGETNAQLPISALLFELDMTAAPGAIVASARCPSAHRGRQAERLPPCRGTRSAARAPPRRPTSTTRARIGDETRAPPHGRARA